VFVAGLHGKLTSIPPGYSQKFILSGLNNAGINAAMFKWGSVLQRMYHTTRMPHDILTTSLGYWYDWHSIFVTVTRGHYRCDMCGLQD